MTDRNEIRRHRTPRSASFSEAVTEGHYQAGSFWVLVDARRRLAEYLKKYRSGGSCLDLADRLEACRINDRCRSAACPECNGACRRLFRNCVMRFVDEHRDRDKIACVRVVPSDGIVELGKLSEIGHRRAVRGWLENLGKAGVDWFIGGTDWDRNGARGPNVRWSEQFLGLTASDSCELLESNLRAHFPETPEIPWPVHVQPCHGEDLAVAVSLMLTGLFYRRTAEDRAARPGAVGADRTTRDLRKILTLNEQRELLLHLLKIGTRSRLLIRGLDFGPPEWAITEPSARPAPRRP